MLLLTSTKWPLQNIKIFFKKSYIFLSYVLLALAIAFYCEQKPFFRLRFRQYGKILVKKKMKKFISPTQYLTLTKNYWIFGTFKKIQFQTSMEQAIASLQDCEPTYPNFSTFATKLRTLVPFCFELFGEFQDH